MVICCICLTCWHMKLAFYDCQQWYSGTSPICSIRDACYRGVSLIWSRCPKYFRPNVRAGLSLPHLAKFANRACGLNRRGCPGAIIAAPVSLRISSAPLPLVSLSSPLDTWSIVPPVSTLPIGLRRSTAPLFPPVSPFHRSTATSPLSSLRPDLSSALAGLTIEISIGCLM
jgi:hypothetical protein